MVFERTTGVIYSFWSQILSNYLLTNLSWNLWNLLRILWTKNWLNLDNLVLVFGINVVFIPFLVWYTLLQYCKVHGHTNKSYCCWCVCCCYMMVCGMLPVMKISWISNSSRDNFVKKSLSLSTKRKLCIFWNFPFPSVSFSGVFLTLQYKTLYTTAWTVSLLRIFVWASHFRLNHVTRNALAARNNEA